MTYEKGRTSSPVPMNAVLREQGLLPWAPRAEQSAAGHREAWRAARAYSQSSPELVDGC